MGCMITVPLELLPLMLIQRADVPLAVRSLLEESRTSREKADLTEAFELAQRAKDLVEGSRDPVSEAVAAVYLADLYRELARPGPALELARQAEHLIQFQAERRHRHNHGVVSYLLALLHHALCSYGIALSYYQQARRQFEDARRHWIGAEELDHARRCEEAAHWVDQLCDCLTNPIPLGTEEIYLPVRAATGGYTIARGQVIRYTLAEEISVAQEHLRSCSRSGSILQLGVSVHSEYFALPVPSDAWAGPETEQGDYLLVQRERRPSEEGPGVVHDANAPDGWLYGRFVRDAVGHISFRPQPRIIGGTPEARAGPTIPADEPMGYVVAILKPASAP